MVESEKINSISETVQKLLRETPAVILGSGATIPLGLPSMAELGDYIINKLNEKYHNFFYLETVTTKINCL